MHFPTSLAKPVAVAVALLCATAAAEAAKFTVLHKFSGGDGGSPAAGLLFDGSGNLYGTTTYGGDFSAGTVFRLDSGGKLKVLHSFSGTDGDYPEAGLALDTSGNLYGTTQFGAGETADGVAFRISPRGRFSLLYAFEEKHGYRPQAGLLLDAKGHLFGITPGGGKFGAGTAFELNRRGDIQVLHAFSGQSDGGTSHSGLVADSGGNHYGASVYGGDVNCDYPYGCGVVFKLTSRGRETVLHTFEGGNDGAFPMGDLAIDEAGNLYGTTSSGGNDFCTNGAGCGAVYRIAPDGTETVLFAFTNENGKYPMAGVVRDTAGNLYGTTSGGGNLDQCRPQDRYGCGLVFKLAPDGTETVLHAFSGDDGAYPISPVVFGADGTLYGTTAGGGNQAQGCTGVCGVIFKVKP